MQTNSYRSLLLKKFQERADKNPAYKLAAFARDLGKRQADPDGNRIDIGQEI